MSFLSYLINGISLGSVYAIIALGYTMVYGIAKMLNFAHGDVIMVGGYAALTMMLSYSANPFVAVLVAIVVCTVLGITIEAIAYRPLRGAASPLAVLITAIGVSYFLQNIVLLIFGSNPKNFQSVVPLPDLKLADGALMITGETIVTIISCIVIMIALTTFINKTKAGQAMLAVSEDRGAAQLMGINVNGTIAWPAFVLLIKVVRAIMITGETIVTIISCIVIMIALTTFINKTKAGQAMLAVSEDRGAAQLMGINVNGTIALTFAIGSGLAAVAGVLLCSSYPSLSPYTGSMPGIKAFVAAVFGGIGSIPGAMIGGILLGIIEILGKAYISSQLADAIVFAVLIVVLLVKPTGLLGKQIQEKV